MVIRSNDFIAHNICYTYPLGTHAARNGCTTSYPIPMNKLYTAVSQSIICQTAICLSNLCVAITLTLHVHSFSSAVAVTYQHTLDARFSFLSQCTISCFIRLALLQQVIVIVNVSNAVCSDFPLFLQICFLLLFTSIALAAVVLSARFQVALLNIFSLLFRHLL